MSARSAFGSVIVASNRGPVSFSRGPAGELVASRGAGGVATALDSALQGGGTWIAAAMSPEDREMAERDVHGRIPVEGAPYSLRYLCLSPEDFDGYYNYVSNGILWFAYHYLWDNVNTPIWDADTETAWTRYRRVNRAFAAALTHEAELLPPPTAFLIQDYHLSLVPGMLRALLPDAPIAHFSHTPIAGPTYVRALPAAMRRELLAGMLGADVLGFHSEGWAENVLMSARYMAGTKVSLSAHRVRLEDRNVFAKTYAMSVDADSIRRTAASPEVAAARSELESWRADAKLIVRVDRFELTKNIRRGFLAYETFLERYPEWRERVKFLALLSPSRTELPEYRAYTDACVDEAARVNEALGTRSWQPIELRVKDDHVAAVAAFGLYDVLFVNPVIDGLNLVSMEGPVANRTQGVLVLSRNAGAYSRLGRYALGVNPHDVGEQAEALRTALTLPEEERAERAQGLARLVRRTPPTGWVAGQLRDLERITARRS